VTLAEAAEKGIERVCCPVWACKEDYFKITIFAGKVGPWLQLYSPLNKVIGQKNPQQVSVFLGNAAEANNFEAYMGKLSPDDNPKGAR
jgi:hypothetical protein